MRAKDSSADTRLAEAPALARRGFYENAAFRRRGSTAPGDAGEWHVALAGAVTAARAGPCAAPARSFS